MEYLLGLGRAQVLNGSTCTHTVPKCPLTDMKPLRPCSHRLLAKHTLQSGLANKAHQQNEELRKQNEQLAKVRPRGESAAAAAYAFLQLQNASRKLCCGHNTQCAFTLPPHGTPSARLTRQQPTLITPPLPHHSNHPTCGPCTMLLFCRTPSAWLTRWRA